MRFWSYVIQLGLQRLHQYSSVILNLLRACTVMYILFTLRHYGYLTHACSCCYYHYQKLLCWYYRLKGE